MDRWIDRHFFNDTNTHRDTEHHPQGHRTDRVKQTHSLLQLHVRTRSSPAEGMNPRKPKWEQTERRTTKDGSIHRYAPINPDLHRNTQKTRNVHYCQININGRGSTNCHIRQAAHLVVSCMWSAAFDPRLIVSTVRYDAIDNRILLMELLQQATAIHNSIKTPDIF